MKEENSEIVWNHLAQWQDKVEESDCAGKDL